jgi:lipid-binding SYLF domain-containing protein
MIRNSIARALALIMAAAPVACATNTPQSEVDAKKASERLAEARTQIDEATAVLREMSAKQSIPMAERKRARCVAVIPKMTSGGLLIGGQGGGGIVSCRTASGWSGPVFIKVGGGSFGLQAGVQVSELLMLVMVEGGRMFQKDFELGVNASVAAGPSGESAQASTADVLTYSRSSGLFAGVDVKGIGVKQNLELANAIYGTDADSSVVLGGGLPAPREAAAFIEQLRQSFP